MQSTVPKKRWKLVYLATILRMNALKTLTKKHRKVTYTLLVQGRISLWFSMCLLALLGSHSIVSGKMFS